MQRVLDHSDQSLVSLVFYKTSLELTNELADVNDVLLFDLGLLNLDKTLDFADHILLLLLFQPLCDLKVVKTDSLDLDLALLIRSQVLSTVFLEAKLVKRCLVASIQLL